MFFVQPADNRELGLILSINIIGNLSTVKKPDKTRGKFEPGDRGVVSPQRQ
jgi:hypothetical protein